MTREDLLAAANRLLHGNRPAIKSSDFNEVILNCQQHNSDCDNVAKAYIALNVENELLAKSMAELERDAKRYRILRAQFMYPVEVEAHIDNKIDSRKHLEEVS